MRQWIVPVLLLAPIGCGGGSTSPAVAQTGERGEVQPLEAAGVHNLFRVSDRVYSGSTPDGDAGFAALERLGVKTIISVDGARPDAEAAARHGIRYVHLPFGYDGIPRDKAVALVRVARDSPGPVYVHCHHGKHRGPAAVAAIQLCADPAWDEGRAEAWMKTAGTDPRYTGLIGLPRSFVRPTAEELARVPHELPSAAPVPDLARVMVLVDERWDHLKLVRAAGWAAPKGHPDVNPPHEALQLAEHYREAARLEVSKRRGADFVKLLGEAEGAASEFESALRATPVDSDRAGRAFTRSAAVCAGCHERYRDRPAAR